MIIWFQSAGKPLIAHTFGTTKGIIVGYYWLLRPEAVLRRLANVPCPPYLKNRSADEHGLGLRVRVREWSQAPLTHECKLGETAASRPLHPSG
jgi:hypothetical protein